MKTSIIIPVYNVYQYLEQCVQSVQKLNSDIEIILVDDGSTDKSGELCDQLAAKDNKIKVVHQENGGLSAARNTGIKNCEGDFVMFLDSDDFVDPEETDKMLSNLNAETDVLVGLYKNFYATESRFEEEDCHSIKGIQGIVPTETFLAVVPEDGRSFYMVAVRFIVKRTALIKKGLFFKEKIYHEDEEWTQRLFCAVDNVFVSDKFFYMYRQNREGAITSSVRAKHLFDSLEILEGADILASEQDKDSVRYHYLHCRMAVLFLNCMLHVCSMQEQEQLFLRMESKKEICIPYLTGKMGSMIKLCNKIFGMKVTCKLLHQAKSFKRG